MELKCSKILYLRTLANPLFIFSLAVFSFCIFFGISGAHAVETLTYEQTIDDGYVSDGGAQTTQTFTASSTNISKIELTFGSQAGAGNACFALCEVPAVNTSDSNYLSIGTPMIDYCSDTPVHPDHTSVSGNTITYTWDSPYPTTVGHYYMFVQNIASCGGHVLPEYGATGNFFGGTWCYGGSCEKHNGGDLVFKAYANPAPTVSGTVYWAGVGSIFGRIGGEWYVPIHYDVCDSYASINDLTASTDMDGEGNPSVEIIHDKSTFIGPQLCRGTAFLVGSVLATSDQTGTTTIQLSTQADGVIATSSVYSYAINNGAPTAYIDNSIISPLKIDFNSSATTSLPFSYNLTGLSWSGGEICVYNQDAKVKTDYCVSVSAVSGVLTMDYPNPPGPYILNATYRFYNSSGNVQLESEPFTLNWYGQVSYSFSAWLGTSTHDMVCSPDEWADTNWWTQIRCSTFQSVLNVAEKISYFFGIAVNGFVWAISKLFPFSVASSFYDSWQASATTALPSELSWLEIADVNGNLHLAFPHQWVGGSTDADYIVFGPSVFTSSSSALANFFAGVRALSKYLMWAGFIFALWRFAHDLYDDLREE